MSALVAHTAWHWMTERYGVLRQFRFTMPVIDAAFLAMAMRWAMLAVILVGAYWLVGMLRVPARDPKRLKSEVRSQI
jgi:hypothetical protein